MGLYERMTAADDSKMSVHAFCSATRLWALGDVTRAQVVAALALDTSDETDLDALQTAYGAAGNGVGKANYLIKIESVFTLAEVGHISKAQAKGILGF